MGRPRRRACSGRWRSLPLATDRRFLRRLCPGAQRIGRRRRRRALAAEFQGRRSASEARRRRVCALSGQMPSTSSWIRDGAVMRLTRMRACGRSPSRFSLPRLRRPRPSSPRIVADAQGTDDRGDRGLGRRRQHAADQRRCRDLRRHSGRSGLCQDRQGAGARRPYDLSDDREDQGGCLAIRTGELRHHGQGRRELFADLACTGVYLLGCEGEFTLTGGTRRFAGITGKDRC